MPHAISSAERTWPATFRPHPQRFLLEDIWESHCHRLPRGFSCAGREKQTAANKKPTELMWVQHLT